MKGETPQTPREELEVRLTALLMGELPTEQAALLEAQIAADAQLKSLHAQLREAIELVREASTIREQPAPLVLARLSNERRERLLKYFKSDLPSVVQIPRRRDWSWVRPLGLAAALIALIGSGLLLDGSFSKVSRSAGRGFVHTAAEGTFWESDGSGLVTNEKAGDKTKWLYVLRDGSIGPDSRASEKNPIIGRTAFWTDDDSVKLNVDASPANASDRFAGAQKSEAKRPWYLAWAGQAPASNIPESDGGRAQRANGTSRTDAAVPFAAAPVPPVSNALPALEPPPAPTTASAPGTSPVLAGIELSRQGRGGGGAGVTGAAAGVPSTFDTLRDQPVNESTSDFSVVTRTGKLAENAEITAQFGSQSTTGGFAGKPAQMLGKEPALRAPDSQPTTDMFAGGRAETYAFRAPVDREKAHSVEDEVGLGFQSNAPASGTLALNGREVSVEEAAKTANAFGDFGGIAGRLPAVRNEGLEALARSKAKSDDGLAAGELPYFRGRAMIKETGVSELAGAKIEQQLDLSSSVKQLSKDLADLNGPAALDPKARFYQEQTLAKGLEAVPEAMIDGLATTLDKNRAESERRTSTGTLDVAKLEAKKVAPEQLAQEVQRKLKDVDDDVAAPQPKLAAPVPQSEVLTSENRFSTFSLNVSDVSFKLAAASLESGTMPDPAAIRSEEFINAFDYRDPEPAPGAPLAFASERARYSFAQNRDLLRVSIKTAAAGRQPGRALNVVLLVDNSGSMERADRVRILHEALRVLAGQLQPQDKLSIITFARTPRLWIDGVAGDKAGEATARINEITPQGGTNLSAALDLGYQTALRHYQVESINRVVLLTDGAANLGNVDAVALKEKVEAHRKQGVALDCFGIGWEGYNDDLLEVLSRNGDGRYGFINTAEEAATVFAAQLAGALRVAAADVKVQVEFNPRRVTAYRQVGYAKHQLTKEQFRDNTVDAAEIGAAEAGNGIYLVEVNPRGEGDLATVRVRFKVPGTTIYREHEWTVPFTPNAPALEQASPALRLAGSASAFSEWLAGSPYAGEITTDALLGCINGVPGGYGADPRPKKLEWMIRQAKSLSGR